MAKKHWIFIKRGLSEDPKHRAQMGECIWLFMHIIDRADWETGIAYDWRDKQEAADMGMNVDTLRAQRRKLEEMGYIACIQKQHSQDIKIMEWINPRDYSGGVKNRRDEGVVETPPSGQGVVETPPSVFQGGSQGGSQDTSQNPTPTYDSESESSSHGATAPEGYPLDWIVATGGEVTEEQLKAEKHKQMVDASMLIGTWMGVDADAGAALALAFMEEMDCVLPESKAKRDRKAARDMLACDPVVKPEHVKAAIRRLRGNGMTVPQRMTSVVETASAIAAEPQEEPEPVPESVLLARERLQKRQLRKKMEKANVNN